MKKIYKRLNLFVGDEKDCFYEEKADWAVVHACKHPCHQRGVGYRGNLSQSHPNYLLKKEKNHLYLNMVDMKKELLPKYMDPIVNEFIDFVESNISSRNILIHCNEGKSRAPSLALLYLAKIEEKINNSTYKEAKKDFYNLYPQYNPGRGIKKYLKNNWDKLMKDQYDK